MDFLDRLRETVIVLDGAMGTSVQAAAPGSDAYQGHEGLNDWLCFSRPDVVRDIHASFLDVGCDVIETNSFGAFPVVLEEYGLGDRSRELCRAAAALARETADAFATADRPRFVAGSMGPGTRLPSLGHIGYRELVAAYRPMALGLVEGGCDLLLIETCQDLLQIRAAWAAADAARRDLRRDLPIGVQFTVETTGTLLTGSTAMAALSAILPLRPAFVGLNCATGPEAMRPHARDLCRRSAVPVSVLPNAGLPRNVDGCMVYDCEPADFAATLAGLVEDFGVGLVGGCCGTTPAHLAALVERVGGRSAPRRGAHSPEALSSLYEHVPLDQEPRPLLIGERTNANGSRLFRRLQAGDDLDGMVDLALAQQEEGAHVLDVSVAYVGRDEPADMAAFTGRLNAECRLPLMIDSTSPAAIEAALRTLAGRSIVNSVNLEDGEERAREILSLCRRFGAAVVALCIDEQGMARTPEHKLAVARRLTELAGEYGLGAADLLIDPLTFTLASGAPEYRDSAMHTLEGIRLIKREIPGARCLLGLSNVSFGLKPDRRRALNSVFLQQALAAGLDAAILHAGKILNPADIPDDVAEACRRLIDDDRRDGDPLARLMEVETVEEMPSEELAATTPAQRLREAILRGREAGLTDALDAELADRPAMGIIDDVLLAAMREVGELFGAGRMQLPFVLKSAAVMKAAVRHLEPHLERGAATTRGRVLLATVRGDVHDIGKNLVGIILGNNGYEVEDLGVKVPVERMIEAILEREPDVVGMSGLLVKSTIVMKENLEALNAAGLDMPVLLGGAALTRAYVERDLRATYAGRAYYAPDAFAGLELTGAITSGEAPPAPVRAASDGPASRAPRPRGRPDEAPVPEPPFWGARIERDIPLSEVWPFLNRPALFKGRWGYGRGKLDREAHAALMREEVEPALERLQASAVAEGWLRPAVVRGYFPVSSDGDALHVFRDPADDAPAWRFDFPRQRVEGGLCLSDYFRADDLLAVFAVTVGAAATEQARRRLDDDDYHDYLLVHGLSVETAEALAELAHARIRRELGIDAADDPDPGRLIRGRYQGRRYSFGYPACPDLSDQRTLADMLGWERLGLELSVEDLLVPEQSVSALVVHHPQAEYFSV